MTKEFLMKKSVSFSVCLILLALGLALVSCMDPATVETAEPLILTGLSSGGMVAVIISQADPSRAALKHGSDRRL